MRKPTNRSPLLSIIVRKKFLYFRCPQQHHRFLIHFRFHRILHLPLILSSLAYDLHSILNTPGLNGGSSYFFAIFFQFIELNQGWFFSSWMPLYPSLLSLFLFNNLFMKSVHYFPQPKGSSSSVILAWWANIFYLIYFLESPKYGRWIT